MLAHAGRLKHALGFLSYSTRRRTLACRPPGAAQTAVRQSRQEPHLGQQRPSGHRSSSRRPGRTAARLPCGGGRRKAARMTHGRWSRCSPSPVLVHTCAHARALELATGTHMVCVVLLYCWRSRFNSVCAGCQIHAARSHIPIKYPACFRCSHLVPGTCYASHTSA